jgi:DNA-binding transcriptional MerR regulator
LKISALAKATGASIRSLRHYEKKGLLLSEREENGYRVYSEAAIEQVKAIQLYLDLGLNTDEIARILSCRALSTQGSPYTIPVETGSNNLLGLTGLLHLYEQKMHAIDREMETLALIKDRLGQRIHWVAEKKARLEQQGEVLRPTVLHIPQTAETPRSRKAYAPRAKRTHKAQGA